MQKIRPFLKWPGNKFQCIKNILATLPTANRLIEPFAGSGSIFLNTTYSSYLLGEQNQDLISLYQYLQGEGESFIQYCAQWFTPENNTATQYYQFRQQFNESAWSRERSALFLYLNRHGYNGLCRYNASRYYNVPFGKYSRPYFPYREMLAFHRKSTQAIFLHGDFRDTFNQAKHGDVIYCDPPYIPLTATANFTSYTDKKFAANEHTILAQLARNAADNGIAVIISNHDTEFTRHHYKDAEISSFLVPRFISRSANNRHPVRELVALFKA